MGDITDTAILGALHRQMTIAVAKQTVAASNLANLETPGYRAREVSFEQALDARLDTTNPRHLGATVTESAHTRETADLTSRRDGNNVQIDHELLTMTRAAGEFSAAQTVLAAKIRLVRYALNEGR